MIISDLRSQVKVILCTCISLQVSPGRTNIVINSAIVYTDSMYLTKMEEYTCMDDVKETGRIEAFSDGVFAVAITLLILNIQPPSALSPNLSSNDSELLNYLLSLWPAYLAFVASFATIGIMWINHHRLFTYIKRTDTILMLLNLLLLFMIVFVPFPTALLAQQYISHPNLRVPALVYNGLFILLAVFFNLLWRYAAHKNRLLDKKADQQAVEAITRQYRFGPLFYVVSFGLAWIYVPASIALNLFMAVYFAFPGRKPRSPSDFPPAL